MAGNGNIDIHATTYHKLLRVLKLGAAACFVVAFVVIWLISGK